MKIYEFALLVLIFSGTVTLFNTLGIFDYNIQEQGYNVTQEQAEGIFQVGTSSDIDSNAGWFSKLEGGVEFGIQILSFLANALSMGANIGGIFYQYIPNSVGLALNVLITGLSWFVYAWGGMQLWRRFSSKGVD